MNWLKQLFGKKQPPKPTGAESIPNPYRRFYSQNRSFEELVKNARKPPHQPNNKTPD